MQLRMAAPAAAQQNPIALRNYFVYQYQQQ
jgi:hypothetical protein